MRRVRIEAATYTHTQDAKGNPTGRARTASAHAIVNEDGSPTLVGLFASEARAEEFCKTRGWRLAG